MLAKQAHAQQSSSNGTTLVASLARNHAEVREAQRLRYRVFAQELGARVPGSEQGIDCDLFDAYCEHLLVRDTGTGEVVGTYRILTGAQARRLGGFYADGEFDLARLQSLRAATVEVGRSCVHPGYRNGATISMLWSGIFAYMRASGYAYLIGCASIGMADGGKAAADIYRRIERTSLGPPEYRVYPRCELPLAAVAGPEVGSAAIPPLIKGYLRLGAWVCGAPARDPDFNTADLFILMPMSRIERRYARHFLLQ